MPSEILQWTDYRLRRWTRQARLLGFRPSPIGENPEPPLIFFNKFMRVWERRSQAGIGAAAPKKHKPLPFPHRAG